MGMFAYRALWQFYRFIVRILGSRGVFMDMYAEAQQDIYGVVVNLHLFMFLGVSNDIDTSSCSPRCAHAGLEHDLYRLQVRLYGHLKKHQTLQSQSSVVNISPSCSPHLLSVS